MMSGLPAGCKGDKTPVWITTSWPPETQDILDYQWNEVAIPVWKEIVKMAADCGIEKIALENHGMQLVYNPETCLRLREAVGPMVGMNLDPSHLFWMGGDPIEAARVLGEHGAIYHIHGKDSRPERRYWQPNGMLDTKPIDALRSAHGTMSRSAQDMTQNGGRNSSQLCACRDMMMKFPWKWRI